MARLTILLAVDDETHEEDLKLFDNWKESHADQISFIGENEGCGCCVHIWNVECADELVSLLPHHFLSHSDWSNPKEK